MYEQKIMGISQFGEAAVRGYKDVDADRADRAQQLLSSLAPLSDEDLLKREIKGEEVRLLAQICSIKTRFSVPEAMTLLRLLPMVAGQSRTVTHRMASFAGTVVRQAYDTAQNTADKAVYADRLKQAGKLCFRPNMRIGINGETQKQEYDLFGPFIQDTAEYRSFRARAKQRAKGTPNLIKEPAVVSRVYSSQRTARYFDDYLAYARV